MSQRRADVRMAHDCLYSLTIRAEIEQTGSLSDGVTIFVRHDDRHDGSGRVTGYRRDIFSTRRGLRSNESSRQNNQKGKFRHLAYLKFRTSGIANRHPAKKNNRIAPIIAVPPRLRRQTVL
jgi:hypothetical protein